MILIDSEGKDENILEICSAIRTDKEMRNIPVIAIISNDTTRGLISKMLEMGVNDYISSPADSHELYARIMTQTKKYFYYQCLRGDYISQTQNILDPVTKLHNRWYFEYCMSRIKVIDNKFLLLLDLDNFKSINDNYGHLAGDIVLVDLVNTIKELISTDDMFFRLGGDEFILLLSNSTKEKAEAMAAKIIDAISKKRVAVDDYYNNLVEISYQCSIGISPLLKNQQDTIRKADKNLYQVKAQGKNNYLFLSD